MTVSPQVAQAAASTRSEAEVRLERSLLTAEQRYWQAVHKARMVMRRNLAAMMRGERLDSGPCGMDLERKFIIAEIDRAIHSVTQHD